MGFVLLLFRYTLTLVLVHIARTATSLHGCISCVCRGMWRHHTSSQPLAHCLLDQSPKHAYACALLSLDWLSCVSIVRHCSVWPSLLAWPDLTTPPSSKVRLTSIVALSQQQHVASTRRASDQQRADVREVPRGAQSSHLCANPGLFCVVN